MASASKAYVVPSGGYLFHGITGEDPYNARAWEGAGNIFNTGDDRGPFGTTSDAWNAQRLGYGVLDAPEALQAAWLESRGRYLGGPNNASWSDSWDQWNATDVVGPDGKTLLSPVHQTGLRVGQDYGARNYDGSVRGPAGGDIFQGFTWAQNKLAQNPYLDPTQALGGYRGMMQGSPYDQPDPSQYAAAMSRAQGGPGAADKYGLRGIDMTNELASTNLRQLSRGIDREAEETLATELPGIQHAMEAAGLGRSGAGQLQMQQLFKDVSAQANRDKQRVMADYTDREANRQSGAINLASQIGAQGYEGYAGRQGQATMAGLADQFGMNEANRQGERALWQQAMDQQNQRYGMDTGNYLNALNMGGQYQLGALDAERMGQSASLQDWFGIQAQRDAFRSGRMNEYLTLADRERAIRQERLNQQLGASMMPYDALMRIATGTTAPSGPQGGSPSFMGNFMGGLAGGAGQAVGGWLGGFGQQGNAGMDLVNPYFGGNA